MKDSKPAGSIEAVTDTENTGQNSTIASPNGTTCKLRLSLVERIYLGLLKIYPAEFRDEYGALMLQLFQDKLRRTSGSRQSLWRVRLLLESMVDLAITAPKEHFDVLIRDVRFGARNMASNRGVTAIALLTIAIGVGATSGISSVAHSVLVRPLPFNEPDRLFMVWMNDIQDPSSTDSVSPANFLDWREQNGVFANMAAIIAESYNITESGPPERIEGFRVSASFFDVLGTKPFRGRTFSEDEDQIGYGQVAVLSHGLWKRRWGENPDAIGSSIKLNGIEHRIVGIMPERFRFPNDAEIWVPTAFSAAEASSRWDRYIRIVGRLLPNVDAERARNEMSDLASKLAQEYPAANKDVGITIVPLHEEIVGDIRKAIITMLGAVAILLLITCTNVANLILSRASLRRAEFAIRAALGATRGRLVRQVVTESVMLGVAGGILGIVVAYLTVRLVEPQFSAAALFNIELGVDFSTVLVAASVVGIAIIGFSLIPALFISKIDMANLIRTDARSNAEQKQKSIGRKTVVVAQVTLTFLLLIGAGLMLRSLINLTQVDPGFDTDNVLTARFELAEAKYEDLAVRRNFQSEIIERINAIAGVESAAVVTFAPLTYAGGSAPFRIEGRPEESPRDRPVAAQRVISSHYFETMGIALVSGRTFLESDNQNGRPIAIVNQKAAAELSKDGVVLGRRIATSTSGPWIDIVGVVEDVRQFEIEAESSAEIYFSHLQAGQNFFTIPFFQPHDIVVRTSVDPMALVNSVRHAIQQVDPQLPLYNIQSMQDVVGNSVDGKTFQVLLVSSFAAIALLVSAVGIYGVISFMVTVRSREIGVRMAVGARESDIRHMVILDGMKLIAIGLLAGVAISVLFDDFIADSLYKTSATDFRTYLWVSTLLGVTGLIASYMPARKAVRIDPMVVLRAE